MAMARLVSAFLILSTINKPSRHPFCAEAFLDATLLLDRLKLHYFRSPSWKITSHASLLSRHSSMAYVDQLHKKRRIKTSLSATRKKAATDKQKPDGSTSPEPKLKRSELIFQQRLSELQEFIDENGHGSIPTPYENNPPLGVWAANLRRQFVIREHAEQDSTPYKGYLTQERLNLLQRSGFDFTSLTERQFRLRLEELKQFKKRYGHTLVPEKYDENMALGSWVSNMRTQYRKRRSEEASPKGTTDDESIAKEETTNISSEQNNNTPVKKRRRRQRSSRNSQLDDAKEKLLDEVGFVWNAIDRKWFEMLEWAKVYAVVNYELSSSRHGNESISLEDAIGCSNFNRTDFDERDTLLLENYYTFVRNIQDQTLLPYFHPQGEILDLLLDENYAESALEQPMQVEEIGEGKMEEVFDRLTAPPLDYRVPVNDTVHYSLKIWMVNQRSNYHRRLQNATDPSAIPSTMTDQRQKALEEINFPWSGRFANRCEEIQYEIEQAEKRRIEIEKAKRREKRLQEEERRIEELNKRQDSVGFGSLDTTTGDDEDIMSLWGAEDDDDW